MKRIFYTVCTTLLLTCFLCGCSKEEPQKEIMIEEENEEFVCVKETSFVYDGDQIDSYVDRYFYDESGKKVFSLYLDVINEIEIPNEYGMDFLYDEQGGVISESYRDARGLYDYCSQYESTNVYDEHGRIIQAQRALPNSDATPTDSRFEYDEDGRLCKETVYLLGTEDLLSYSNPEDFEYDSNGNIVKQKLNYTSEDTEETNYYDYRIVEYEYVPLSEYIESQSVGIEGKWNNLYDCDLTWEISSSDIKSDVNRYYLYQTNYEIVDAHNLKFTDSEESANTPYLKFIEDGTEYLFIPGLLPQYGGFLLERSDTSKNRNWLAESEVNEGSAKVIASQLIERYWRYCNFQQCCNIELAGDGRQFMENELFDKLTAEEQSAFAELEQMLGTAVDKVLCCKTVEEVNQHMKQYLDPSLIISEITEEGTYIIDGELYIQRGTGVGIDSYDTNPGRITIESAATEEIIAVTSYYNSGGEKMGSSKFYISKIDGSFKLMKIE